MSAETAAPEEADGGDFRMSLGEHLQELRSRLLRVSISVLILGGLSLAFAKPIFGLLMRPVLDALPPDARSLVYTSGIEEINVLMKVGLYNGIFLSTPVLLLQLWGFVAPGLYPSERKYAGPFVAAGTLAFLIGAAFCYLVVLPQMFQFLLKEGDTAKLATRVEEARLREQDALRALTFGDPVSASTLAQSATTLLAQDVKESLLQIDPTNTPSPKLLVTERMDGLGRLMDAAHASFGATARPVLKGVMEKRALALDAFGREDYAAAETLLDEAASALAAVSASHTSVFGDLWKLERDIATSHARHTALAWTRPMLTMHEQLSLVLLLILAFGIIFELPLVMALLATLGVVRASFLFKYQRHAFVLCLIAGAVITPTGDAVNLALMCGPMFLCYELGVVAAWFIERRRARNEASVALTPPQ